jgi:hypothetical protein
MSSGSPKVYVIKKPGSSGPPEPIPSTQDEPGTQSHGNPSNSVSQSRMVKQTNPRESRKALTLAYLVGPVTISRWLSGRSSLLWSALGFGSVLTGFCLLMLRSRFDAWVETTSFGLLWWFVIVPPLVLLIGFVWARSVTAAGRLNPVAFSRLPKRLRSPAAVAAAGVLVPGLGLTLTGRSRLAGCAFLLVAPLAAAAVVFSRWHWLWDRSRTPVPAGVSGHGLEVVFVATIAVASVSAILWLIQALDGARRVSSSRSLVVADTASLALLASLAVFAVAFRPASLALNLHSTAVTLRSDGYQLIPLGLNEAAVRLDPATPAYLAEAVELYGAVGMWDKAREKSRLLEERAKEYTRLAFGGHQEAMGADFRYRSPYVDNNLSPYNRLQRLALDSPPR